MGARAMVLIAFIFVSYSFWDLTLQSSRSSAAFCISSRFLSAAPFEFSRQMVREKVGCNPAGDGADKYRQVLVVRKSNIDEMRVSEELSGQTKPTQSSPTRVHADAACLALFLLSQS
jgi:hypothetical protein